MDPALAAAGDGVRLSDAGSELRVLDSTVVPGSPGTLNDSSLGNSGQDFENSAGGILVLHPGITRSHFVSGPTRELAPGVTSITGQPGETVLIYLGVNSLFAKSLKRQGVFLLQALFNPLIVGAIPASGQLDIHYNAPDLDDFGLGTQHLVFLEQSLLFTPQGVRMTGVSSWIELDSSY